MLIDDNKILLMKQTSENGGNFTLPGGTVEDNEFAKFSLIREVLEETGILVDINDLKLVHTLHKKKNTNTRIVLYFKTNKWIGEPTSRELEKFNKVKWCDLDNLPKSMSVTVEHVLRRFNQGELYSELSKK